MGGVEERVQGFLDSWPIVKEQLEEILKEDERLFYGDRACRPLPSEPEDDLPETVGETDTSL